MSTLETILKKFDLKIPIGLNKLVEIPDAGRADLAALLGELGFNLGAEIGVLDGVYSEILCQLNPKLKLFCIDPWERTGNYGDYNNHTLARCYENAKARLAGYNCEIIKKTSAEAIKDFADGSLDFVYIDGNHQDPDVTFDVNEWSKKVHSGGIVSGHDFVRVKSRKTNMNWKVKDAVTNYVATNNIPCFFTWGSKAYEPGKVRDASLSWMFVKPTI